MESESVSLHMLLVERIVGRSLGEATSCCSDAIKQNSCESEECAPIVAKSTLGRWRMFWSTSWVKRGFHACFHDEMVLPLVLAKIPWILVSVGMPLE